MWGSGCSWARWALHGALLLCSSTAWAHQITGVNVGTVVELIADPNSLQGTYALQYGELSGFDERKRMDLDGDGTLAAGEQSRHLRELERQLASRLILEVDGERMAVGLEDGQMLPEDPAVVPEQMTLQFKLSVEPIDFTERRALLFRDENETERVVHADIQITASDELDLHQPVAQLPDNALRKVLVRSPEEPVQAEVVLEPAAGVWSATPFDMDQEVQVEGAVPEAGSAVAGTDTLKEMLRSKELGLSIVLVALGLSIFLGAAHALEPGHGKTLVAAYLVGSRGTVGHAVFLGGVVTFTHTFSVILLGVITLFASQYILPETVFMWLGPFSGLLIMGLGVWLFVRSLVGSHGHGHRHGPLGQHLHGDEEEHVDEHSHGDTHGHSHDAEHEHALEHDHGRAETVAAPLARRSVPVSGRHEAADTGRDGSGVSLGTLLTLGITGGLVPCPGALVILLLAVALHRIAFGLLLIVAFSFGLAAILIVIGILMVRARSVTERLTGESRLIQRLPMVSSVVIIGVGFAMAVRSLMEAGILIVRL